MFLYKSPIKNFGYVSRMDNLQAAVLNFRLHNLKKVTNIRRKNADIYLKNLNLEKIYFPIEKKDEFNLRTIVKLPNGNGKKIKVAVLCEESKITEAKKSGAELFDSNTLVNNIMEFPIILHKIIMKMLSS